MRALNAELAESSSSRGANNSAEVTSICDQRYAP